MDLKTNAGVRHSGAAWPLPWWRRAAEPPGGMAWKRIRRVGSSGLFRTFCCNSTIFERFLLLWNVFEASPNVFQSSPQVRWLIFFSQPNRSSTFQLERLIWSSNQNLKSELEIRNSNLELELQNLKLELRTWISYSELRIQKWPQLELRMQS